MNLKALVKALTPDVNAFYFISGIIAFFAVLAAIGAAMIGAVLGITYILSLFLSNETIEIIGWIFFGSYCIWLMFYDTVKRRYEEFCIEGDDDVR